MFTDLVTLVFILPVVLEKGGDYMPRLSKKYKLEWNFFLDDAASQKLHFQPFKYKGLRKNNGKC